MQNKKFKMKDKCIKNEKCEKKDKEKYNCKNEN